MVSGFPFSEEWQSQLMVRKLFNAARWNQYTLNWPVTLAALRQLWEMGKVSQLKTPFYEPLEKPGDKS